MPCNLGTRQHLSTTDSDDNKISDDSAAAAADWTVKLVQVCHGFKTLYSYQLHNDGACMSWL